jgi:CHAT domain-containing protein
LLPRLSAGEDVEPESYLDMAVTKWLPRRDEAQYAQALAALANGFEERHHDPWLRDVLAVKRSEGLQALADAAQANLADESDTALAKSVEAAKELRKSGNEAGALRADFERTWALRRGVRSGAECVDSAMAEERQAERRNYFWIQTQAVLEQGNCLLNRGDSGAAQKDMARGRALARNAGYPDLELRAEGLLAGMTTGSDLLLAWTLGRAGLARYWHGSSSGSRGQQLYANLAYAAKNLGLSQAAYVLAKEEAQVVAETPRRRAEAATRAVLAAFAADAGQTAEARAEFDRAAGLFDQLHETAERPYRAIAEVNRARAELAADTPQAALRRLETLRPSVEKSGAEPIRISFEQVLGDSLYRSGRRDLAEAAYRRAIDLNESRLMTLRGSRERAERMLAASGAYRGLVQLLWDRGDSIGALRLWEWFRSGDQPGSHAEPDLDQRRARLRDESYLSYAVLPAGAVAWLIDDRKIMARRLTVNADRLDIVTSRFLRECADAGSDPSVIRRDARQLYDWLLAPLADQLDPARTLVIEPDGPLGAVPMQALMDEKFRYLSDRFAIAIAGGLTDYQQREAIGPLGPDLKALVVANPLLEEEAAKTFPPLPGTMQEARFVAHAFRNSVMLTSSDATAAAIERHRSTVGLFHFAGHGFSNAGNGGLLLSPEDPRSGVEILDGKRMASQDWSRCRLAVLSACSTGTGETSGPVNPESLVRGLLWAGAARVVASRWNVDTETSVPFMEQFYTELLSGKNPAAALQSAARRIRDNKATDHPYYWAGFQTFGAR